MDGFHGRVLHIDVGNKKYCYEEVNDSVFEKVLGGKGLGSYLLLKHNREGIDPLSPENNIIFTIGPATDTKVYGAARYAAFSKSPLTGFFGEAYAGGRVSEPISRTGNDAVVISGASKSPIFLEVTEDKVIFHDATHLWGKNTYETEDLIKQSVGRKDAGVAVIGPAGENLVRFAVIENNYWRSLGRTGLGAVLGSKKIKGLAFYGNRKKVVSDQSILESLYQDMKNNYMDHPSAVNYRTLGTPALVPLTNLAGAFPTKYWTKGTYEDWKKLTIDYLRTKADVKSRACPRCFLACGKLTKIQEGRHQGLEIEGPEYETIGMLGGLCMVDDIREVAYLNDVCDRLGLDTISAGNVIGFAIAASKIKDIGINIDYGDVDGIVDLLHKISRREGVGNVLADGVKMAADAWGLSDLAIHVKGLEPPAYDPRVLKGMGLTYATSDRGACHLRSNVMKPELSGAVSPDQIEGKAEIVIDLEDRHTLFDALIICRFFRDLYDWERIGLIIKGTTGLDLSKDDLQKMALHITDIARKFNLREGMTKADDTLPRRFFEEELEDSGKVMARSDFDKLLKDYYALKGWD